MEQAELIYNPVFTDDRGTFAPLPIVFEEGKLPILKKNWIQSNISVNPKKWTLRGLHYQSEPFAQTKLVKVITGRVIDFIVDIRKDSTNFGKCYIFEIIPNMELYVPKGFTHGFITTEDNTVVQYLVDERYNQPKEGSILWSSVPSIVEYLNSNIKQFDTEQILISDKDRVCQNLSDYVKGIV